MPDTPARSSPASDQRAVAVAVRAAWQAFFERFREDEQQFERLDYAEDQPRMLEALSNAAQAPVADATLLAEALGHLDRFAQRRFEEQNRRIDELVELCEQMRQRLESSELRRSHLEDECGHSLAIITAAIAHHKLGAPTGLSHPPRLHNLINHLVSHVAPQSPSLDTASYLKTPEAVQRGEAKTDESGLDYERLRRLFRTG